MDFILSHVFIVKFIYFKCISYFAYKIYVHLFLPVVPITTLFYFFLM